MTFLQDITSWQDQARNMPWWNISGETAPAKAVLKVSGYRTAATGGTILECTKPDGAGTIFAANSAVNVPTNTAGRCSMDWPNSVLADATGEIGPASGSWEMSNGGDGFRTIGDLNAGAALVVSFSTGESVFEPSYFSFQKILQYTGSTLRGVPAFDGQIFNGDEAFHGIRSGSGAYGNVPWVYDDDETNIKTNGNITVSSAFNSMLVMTTEFRDVSAQSEQIMFYLPTATWPTYTDSNGDNIDLPISPAQFITSTLKSRLEYNRGAGWITALENDADYCPPYQGAHIRTTNFGAFAFQADDILRVRSEVPNLGVVLGARRYTVMPNLLMFDMKFSGLSTPIGVQP